MATVPRTPLSTRTWPADPNGVALRSQSTQSLNLALNVINAPTSYDWPNPVLPKPNLELRTWTQGITVLEEPAPAAPPRCYDFPNPTLAKPNLELRTWVQPAGPIRIPANTKPPTCLDFPNPTLAKPNLELRTWTQSVGTLRMPAVVKVPTGTTYDRPNPVRKEYRSIYSFVSEMNDEVIPPPVVSDTGNGSSNPHPKHFRSMRSTRGRR